MLTLPIQIEHTTIFVLAYNIISYSKVKYLCISSYHQQADTCTYYYTVLLTMILA